MERATSTNKTDKLCQAICAFANDMPGHGMPGYLFIGADDRTGEIAGIEITDRLLQNLAGHRDSGQIVPLPSLTVQKHSFSEGDIAVVEVKPSDMPPVRYRGRVWIRVGPCRGIATAQALLQKNGNPPAEFDVRQATFFLVTVREAGA